MKKLILFLLIVTFFASVNLWAQYQQDPFAWYRSESELAQIAEEAKPRFVGEIGGIYIVPNEDNVEELVPAGYTTYERLCGDARSTVATFEEAGDLDFSIELPDEYELQLDDMNTGAVACNGIVYVSRRAYTYRLMNGSDAYVSIASSILDYETLSFAHDRFVESRVDGERVVAAYPITEDGSVGIGYAWFPDMENKISILSSGLPRVEFVRLLEIIATTNK